MKKLIENNEVDLNASKFAFLSQEAKNFLEAGLKKNHHRRATS